MMNTLYYLTSLGLSLCNPFQGSCDVWYTPRGGGEELVLHLAPGECATLPPEQCPGDYVMYFYASEGENLATMFTCGGVCDVNFDGDVGTDADIEEFLVEWTIPPWHAESSYETADWDQDGVKSTNEDIEAFFRTLGGG